MVGGAPFQGRPLAEWGFWFGLWKGLCLFAAGGDFHAASKQTMCRDTLPTNSELRDDRGNVVALFLRTESPNLIHECGQ